jgi:hypothetical protein
MSLTICDKQNTRTPTPRTHPPTHNMINNRKYYLFIGLINSSITINKRNSSIIIIITYDQALFLCADDKLSYLCEYEVLLFVVEKPQTLCIVTLVFQFDQCLISNFKYELNKIKNKAKRKKNKGKRKKNKL